MEKYPRLRYSGLDPYSPAISLEPGPDKRGRVSQRATLV